MEQRLVCCIHTTRRGVCCSDSPEKLGDDGPHGHWSTGIAMVVDEVWLQSSSISMWRNLHTVGQPCLFAMKHVHQRLVEAKEEYKNHDQKLVSWIDCAVCWNEWQSFTAWRSCSFSKSRNQWHRTEIFWLSQWLPPERDNRSKHPESKTI